tara:strand:+ start:1950 stop:3173 length:1224 start_codon:yes stop_codon:yes gene_type:complete
MNNQPQLPLSGIRIADFGWMIAGPLATRVFGNFGADVIRIESTARIDEIRVVGARPFKEESPNVAGVFNDINTSKRSITLNLGTDEGLELAKQIIQISDVVSNNFRGDRMGKWGLDYENLKKIKPDVILISMPTSGSDGPHKEYGGNGINIIAGAGISGITGFPERPPVGTGSLYPDFAGNPNHAALAILAAIRHRNHTGEGQFIDLSQTESTASLLGTNFLEYTANKIVPERLGNSSNHMSPHGVFPCEGKDRWIAITITNNKEWHQLINLMDNPMWANNPDFETFEGRKKSESEIHKHIQNWTKNQKEYPLMKLLQSNGIPAGVIQTTKDLLENDPGFTESHVHEFSHPEVDTITVHKETINISNTEPIFKRAPLIGEDTDQILNNLLGLKESDINDLYIREILK